MRLFACIALVAAAACNSADSAGSSDAAAPVDAVAITELDIDVTVSSSQVHVYATEVARSCRCTAGRFPQLGSCEDWSDGIQCDCDPGPANCLHTVRLERDGVVIGEAAPLFDIGNWSIGLSDRQGVDLVLIGCGGSARIALGEGDMPVPTITNAEYDSTTAFLRIDWTASPPAATSMTSHGNGFVNRRCHRAGTDPLTGTVGDDYVYWYVHPLNGGEPQSTGLGTVRVWRGDPEQGHFLRE